MFDKVKLSEFFINGGISDVDDFVKSYIDNMGGQLKSLIFRQYIVMDAFIEANNFFDDKSSDKEELGNKFGSVEVIDLAVTDIYMMKEYLLNLLTYMNCDISLNTVAEYIGLSPAYFSTIFKQESGVNFIDYLTKIRINEAKRLLRSSDKRISDIALEVGYRDQHYFSSLFKRYQKDTPKAYREKKNEK